MFLEHLQGRAEKLFKELTADEKALARALFLRLVRMSEFDERRRRRVPRSELTLLMEETGVMGSVIDRFGKYRLLTFDRDPITREPTVEIAHEALIREWLRLRNWIEDYRDDLIVQRRLTTAAREWREADRDPGLLATSSRLRQYDEWANETRLTPAPIELEFLEASLENEASVRAREEALERRALNRLRALVGVLAAAALIAGGLTIFAFSQRDIAEEQTVAAEEERGRAEEQAIIAESERDRAEEQTEFAQQQARIATARELASASITNLDKDPQRSILLALQAVSVTRSAGEEIVREAEEALHRAVFETRLELIITPEDEGGLVSSVAAVFSPDGDRLAVGAADGTRENLRFTDRR